MNYSFEDSIIKIKHINVNENQNMIHYKFNIDNELYFILSIDKELRRISLGKMMYKKKVIESLNNLIIHDNINMYFTQLSEKLSASICSNNRKIPEYKEIVLLISKLKYLNVNSFFKEFQYLDDIKNDTSLLFRIHNNMLYVMNMGKISYLLSITNRLVYEPDKNQLLISKVRSYDFIDMSPDELKKIELLYSKCDLETMFFIYNTLLDDNDDSKMQQAITENFLSLIS